MVITIIFAAVAVGYYLYESIGLLTGREDPKDLYRRGF